MKKQPINAALLASIAAGAALKTQDTSPSAQAPSEIACALIDPNPYQPRLDYDPTEVRALADSIKEYGLLQSIVVRHGEDRYTIVAGHTRLEAFKLLGRDTIPANIIDVSDIEMASLALIENVQRSDLHPLEIQIAISREPFASMKDEEIAQILGYSNVTKVRNIRSISRLSEEVREHMTQHRPKIGVDLLVEIQKFDTSDQFHYYELIIRGQATRQELRNWLSLKELKKRQETRKSHFPLTRVGSVYKIDSTVISNKDIKAFENDLHTIIKKYRKG